MLDAGIVDEDVGAAETREGVVDQALGALWHHQIGTVIKYAHIMRRLELAARRLDHRVVAQPVDHDVGARLGKRPCNAEADAACRSGDDRDASGERFHGFEFGQRLNGHVSSPWNLECPKDGGRGAAAEMPFLH